MQGRECNTYCTFSWDESFQASLVYFRQIRDTVNWIFCEQMLVCYISVFRDTFWPDGKLAPHIKARTDYERTETKERAQQKLLDNIPGSNTHTQAWLIISFIMIAHVCSVKEIKNKVLDSACFSSSTRCTHKSSWPAECALRHHQDLQCSAGGQCQ